MIEPYSAEWYKREQDWIDECQAHYNKAAAALVADGWERQESDRFPALFVKGDEQVILARQLGSPGPWHPRAVPR